MTPVQRDGRLFQLADRIFDALDARGPSKSPYMVGIAGSPGAGKTTLARALASELRTQGLAVAYVPMDGFHLADAELERLGRVARKGAIDTFDASGYVNLLERIKNPDGFTVYAPNFERSLEQPIAGAIPVHPHSQVVITEGNYLLCPDEPWVQLRTILDQIWHCQVSAEVRQGRLVARHVVSGKSHPAAIAWVENVDEPNARLIEAWRAAADLLI
ncbi:nucleoside/nucleotide kinase family protein [Actinomycetaceae bacterium WB03_NA08]|uniref:UDP-N-acetylglucosamine kinase n=1 Tax=Scrofimicrobium canadense TaxID=2652290 RepID=A0A6N7VNJ7_9ACTO|nr:nucleoside/nucleotide kinase family protein [Scrofimicrobium canadense]MSS83284.1 nucleoside/nucleotide kinase family protein [Scrofimicrobium canadense]